jgi:hypothetical protein
MPNFHDRYLEEDPVHPDDCACRECREETVASLISDDETSVYDEKHPDDCACRKCLPSAACEHGAECNCDLCTGAADVAAAGKLSHSALLDAAREGAALADEPLRLSSRMREIPINDTHRCSGGPEEITDEEWDVRARFLAGANNPDYDPTKIERAAAAGCVPDEEWASPISDATVPEEALAHGFHPSKIRTFRNR